MHTRTHAHTHADRLTVGGAKRMEASMVHAALELGGARAVTRTSRYMRTFTVDWHGWWWHVHVGEAVGCSSKGSRDDAKRTRLLTEKGRQQHSYTGEHRCRHRHSQA